MAAIAITLADVVVYMPIAFMSAAYWARSSASSA